MNKQQLLQLAKRNVDERRFRAEDDCERTLSQLRNNNEWNKTEYELRQAQINLAMGVGNLHHLQARIEDLQSQQTQLIDKLGLTAADLKPKYTCAKCNDNGYVNGKICYCLEQEIRKLIVAESNVTNASYTFDNSTETDKHNIAVYKKAKELCVDGYSSLLLTGNTGSGKTFLLTACANKCAEVGKSVLFVTAYTLNSMLLDAHLSDTATCQAILDSLVDVDVLAIDDLGTENVYKNVTAEYLFSVLNERIARGNQTFVSTNLTLNAIRERYDERIFSRLIDQKITFVAQLIGNDKRLSK